MSVSRNWTYLNDSDESLSEEQREHMEPTLNALAAEWSQIQTEIEREGFRRQSDYEDGGRELPECENCSSGYLEDYRDPLQVRCARCHESNPQVVYVRITCPACNGDGVDHRAIKEAKDRERQRGANREVRLEIIEEMLERYGARMMRPYEHWNEDERYMQYMEEGRY